MKNKLCYLVDIIENNEECVILKVKDNATLDLIKLGCFDGNEELIRLTKGEDHTCTIFRTNDKPFSWYWGRSGYTLVSDNVSTMGKLIESCITEDFDIYIGEDKNKVRETMNIMSLDDSSNSSHFIEMMYWKDGNDVSVHKDNSFYKFFKNTIEAKKHFEALNYDISFKNKYIAGTGCIVEEYDISKNKELKDWKEEPYFLLLTDLDELNDKDSFSVARVINGVNCVELHYVAGKATIEYGTRTKDDEWENIIEDIDWYDKNMSEDEIANKLWNLFEEHYENTESVDKLCDKIHNEFIESELRNYATLESICQKNNIMINDYLYVQGYHHYLDYKDDLRFLPRKELSINEILDKVPKTIKEYIDYPIYLLKKESRKEKSFCDSQDDLVYADNEVCYYDCHDGDYVYIDTQDALGFKPENENSIFKNQVLFESDLTYNNIQVDDNKSLYNEISIKYNLYDCVKNNCYISESFKRDIENVQKITEFKVLSNCVDFPILKENLSNEILKDMEKGLESFEYYQGMYDDGNVDIISDYTSKYGNQDLIDWYEGMMTTDSLIETLKCDMKNMGEVSNEL